MSLRALLVLSSSALLACGPLPLPATDAAIPVTDASVVVDGGGVDSGTSTPDAGQRDAGHSGEPCPSGQQRCAGSCTDVSVNTSHCGACGKSCPGEQLCSGGTCRLPPVDCRSTPCPNGYYCDLNSGECKAGCALDTQCPQPGSCNLATRTCECAASRHVCNGQCIVESPTSCGAACLVCPQAPTNGQATCETGRCGFTCNDGYRACGGKCVLESPSSCGASCTVCPAPPANAVAVCSSGSCGFTCQPGLVRCGAGCCAAEAVSLGEAHSCAITAGGGLSCWGRNNTGRLGDGTMVNRSLPVSVKGLGSGVLSVSAGGYHTCAVVTGGAVKCWGRNDDGQLGDGSATQRNEPVAVTGLQADVVSVSTGWYHSCALKSDGTVHCWGRNDWGQLGDGTETSRSTPVKVKGLPAGAVTALATGEYFTCAVVAGQVHCFGSNAWQQLGPGTTADGSVTPVLVTGLSGVTQLTVGESHACALTGAGVSCWGAHGGRLGNGTASPSSSATPLAVTGLGSVLQLSASTWHTCALQSGGDVKCWGYNGTGQVGDGTTTKRNAPVSVVGLAGAVSEIRAGEGFACVRLQSGRVQCWGDNVAGQLGDGTTVQRPTPGYISP